MAKFRRIECSIWENDDFIGLSAGSQIQFIYILTNPARTESGLYRLSSRAMFWKTNTRSAHFAALTETPLVEWDEKTQLVWIVSALDQRYYKPNPNIWKSVIADLRAYWPHRFVKAFFEKYKGYSEIGDVYGELC